MQVAATMGAVAFQKDLGATHSLAHPLSTGFGLNHGLANALCLPAVMRFNLSDANEHYARLAGMFGVPVHSMTQEDAAAKSVNEVECMIERLDITRGLRNHGVPRESLAPLSRKAFEDSCHKTNIRPCTQADLSETVRGKLVDHEHELDDSQSRHRRGLQHGRTDSGN